MKTTECARPFWLLMTIGVAVTAACANQPPEPAQFMDAQELTATVTGLDRPSRLISLRSEEGDELTFVAGDNVRNLDQVAVGDRVVLGYYSGIAAEVADHDDADAPGTIEVGGARAEAGERPAGLAGVSVSQTVTIEAVDTRRNTVTFRGEDGLVRAVDVKRPEMQSFIQGLRGGDKVRLTFTEAIAVRVEPAS